MPSARCRSTFPTAARSTGAKATSRSDTLVALFMGNDDVAVTKYTSERPSVRPAKSTCRNGTERFVFRARLVVAPIAGQIKSTVDIVFNVQRTACRVWPSVDPMMDSDTNQ